jgi:hypothetical protein
MFSLKPKEGGGAHNPARSQTDIALKIGLVLCIVFIAGLAYSAHNTKTMLEARIAGLEQQLATEMETVRTDAGQISADLNVVTKRLGVTAQELEASRQYAEKLRLEQEAAREQLASTLASELATKASSNDVALARQEATTKLAEVQQTAEARIGTVSGEVKVVSANLDATRADLAASRRELVDVRNTLSQDIARNASELNVLRAKGDRDFFEFDIRKGKKDVMTRVADIQMELRKTDVKKQKYDIIVQVDDSKLEKKERTTNEPVQFLVGRDKLRYEVVVNLVEKDRIRGYISAPKDKVLAAERPIFRIL